LLPEANVPVHFRTQQQAKYNSLQLTANSILAYSFNSCSIQGNIQVFRLTGLPWWQKLPWFFKHFLYDLWILQFSSAFTGVIFLDQSQFFATHNNQWDCFILYRQQITSNGIFFSCLPKWAKASPWVMLKHFWIEKL